MLLDKSIRIRAPADRVYEWLATPARQPLWDKSVLRAAPRSPPHDAAPPHEGELVDRVTRALGLRLESSAETIAAESGRLYAWQQVEGDYEQHRGAFLLHEADGETLVRLVADVDLPFVLPRLATEAEVRDSISRDADEALFNLKRLVESARATAAG